MADREEKGVNMLDVISGQKSIKLELDTPGATELIRRQGQSRAHALVKPTTACLEAQ